MARKSDKQIYYKIGEACKLLDIQPYVLRYWETEFPALSPSKSRSGQRTYSEKELTLIRRIQQLLYQEGYTIAGAKKKLEAELEAGMVEEVVEAVAEGEEPPPLPTAEASEGAGDGAVEAGESEALTAYREGVRRALEETRALLTFLDSTS